jgi:hypothetical protein
LIKGELRKEGRKEKKNASKPVSGHLFFSLPEKKLKNKSRERERERERVVRLRRSVSDALE